MLQLRTQAEFEAANGVKAPAGKRYFQHTQLHDIVGSYPFRSGLADGQLAEEKNSREAFLDFLLGVLVGHCEAIALKSSVSRQETCPASLAFLQPSRNHTDTHWAAPSPGVARQIVVVSWRLANLELVPGVDTLST